MCVYTEMRRYVEREREIEKESTDRINICAAVVALMSTRPTKLRRTMERDCLPPPVTDHINNVNIYRFKGTGTEYRMLQHPLGLAVNHDGVLYVSDTGCDAIVCYRLNGTFVRKWGTTGDQSGQFRRPHAIAIGIYDAPQHALLQHLTSIPELCAFPPGILPMCVAYIGDECVYVCDRGNHRIQCFRANGSFMHAWGSKGKKTGQFNEPYGCAVDSRGELVYVTDYNNDRIQMFRSDGTLPRTYGETGTRLGQFSCPTAVALGQHEDMYVADSGNSRIQRLHEGCWSLLHPPFTGYINCPEMILALPDGVLITDSGEHCIHYISNGHITRRYGTKGKRCSAEHCEFNEPCAIAIYNNRIIVTDHMNGRIVVYRSAAPLQ
jgi:DNA-binding beta-propeller fold protein YncE